MADKDEVEANELRLFVSSTLKAIISGVAAVQADARLPSAHGTGEFAFSAPEEIVFDVAVTARQTGTASGGLKIQVFSIGANASGDTSSESSTVSRIQFKVPTKYKRDREVRHEL